MKKQKSTDLRQRNRILNHYACAAGHGLLLPHIDINVPAGWVDILVDLFNDIRRYHPQIKITSVTSKVLRYGYGIRFSFGFSIPPKAMDRSPKLPRSLRWLEIQARKKALKTCVDCGRQFGSLRYMNLCAVCACKKGVRDFG